VPPEAIPFAGLLAELRSGGFGVGMHEYQDLVLLASRWKGTDPIAFRDAVAALIARNRDDVEAIRELFDEWLAREEAPAPAPPPPSEPERVRWKVWHVAAIVLAAAVAIGALAWWSIDRSRDDAAAATDTTITVTSSESTRPPPPPLPPEPREEAAERPWILAAVLLVAALVASAVPETRKRQRQWARKYWRSVLAAKPGPHAYEQRVMPSEAPLPRHVVEDVATILGRAVEPEAVGERLDVEESLRVTLREGLRPHLIFEPPPRNVPVLVLIDAAWQMRPWRRKVDSFVAGLARQGVVLDRWYFDGDPLRVSRTPHDLLVPLEQLAATRGESPLLVLGSGQTLTAESIEGLQRVLKKWTFRTWVHPAGNPQYWRRELARLPLRMWPMTAAGLRAAAVEIARHLDSGETPLGVAAPRAVTRDDVRRMKELIAHVPHPSLELAEELRRKFARDIPEEVLLFLGAEGIFYGDAIRLPPEELQQLMASADPEREREVRRYLLEVLRDSEPAKGSVAHLRWQLDEALHRLRLDDPGAVKTLQSLAEGPLQEEVRAALAVVQDPRIAPVAARSVPTSLPERPPATLGRRPPLWAWPRWQVALPAAALALVTALLLGRWAGEGKGAVIPHERDAYTLTWVEPKLHVKHAMTTFENASLYRNGTAVWQFQKGTTEADYEVSAEDRGAWYDVRAPLQRGNLAVSEPVWVPSAKPGEPVALRWIDDAISYRVLLTCSWFSNDNPAEEPVAGVVDPVRFWPEFGGYWPDEAKTLGQLAQILRERFPNGPAIVILTGSRGRYMLTQPRAGGISGVFDQALRVPAGTYTIDVNGETITLRPNELLRKTVSLQERDSTALVRVTLSFDAGANAPPMSVYEYILEGSGGTFKGRGGEPLAVPAGQYRLTVPNAGHTQTITIPSTPSYSLSIDFTKPPDPVAAEAIKNIEWSIADTGDVDCPEQYVAPYTGCAGPGGRACLMKFAISNAKSEGWCSVAFDAVLVTQCHNPAAQESIRRWGADNVCAYLKTK